ncbi:hypothetical protein [Schlesneria sp. T3-172]|uniref:hypothetical protein n=1 Tax=Schlesneria sphaerica TaxID=3373610 RepID=UPI0037C72029
MKPAEDRSALQTPTSDKTTIATRFFPGIGREITQFLAERGARVCGTVFSPQSARSLRGVDQVRMTAATQQNIGRGDLDRWWKQFGKD